MILSVPYVRRKLIGMTHRCFGHYGRASTQTEVLDTVKLLFPRKYCGNVVRVGGCSDGAYVLPDALQGISASISPGVSEEIDFDLELGSMGIYSYMYDASVSHPARLTERQHFKPKFIDSYTSNITETLDNIVDHVSGRHPGDLLLQMDIEGAEYRCLDATTTATLGQFRIIVLEFHDLEVYISNYLYRRYWIHPVLKKLRMSHDVLHVHANNYGCIKYVHGIPIPSLLEITYLRRDFWPADSLDTMDCRQLDILNRNDKPELVLDGPWFDNIKK